MCELSKDTTEAELALFRDPGFAFGLKLVGGSYTDAALVRCARLPSLVSLTLANGRGYTAAGMSELAQSPHLAVLELRHVRANDTWLSALKPLNRLLKLELSGNYDITDAGLANLSGMTQLRTLVLTGTRVRGSGLAALSGAKQLERVALPEQTDAALRELAKFGKLHALAEALTEAEEVPESAAGVKKFIVRGPVTDAGLREVKAFPNLTHLYLRTDKLTPGCLPFLKTLRTLKYLEPGIATTDEQRRELRAALPGCDVG
ncbi:MAG TPA: hypothetical protein VGE74_29310 [Gemmata sp.]